jgi:hypothetical protein
MTARFLALVVFSVAATACIAQSAECQQYLQCAEDLSPGSREALDPDYGPEGTCWKLTAATAAACAEACSKALSDAGSQPGAPASCTK